MGGHAGVLPPFGLRIFRLARDTGLAEPAPVIVDAKPIPDIWLGDPEAVLPAAHLVMPSFSRATPLEPIVS